MLGGIMYETTTHPNACEFALDKWDKPSKSESLESSWSESRSSQSLRLGCAACDRRRSRLCDHKTSDGDCATAIRNLS